MKVRGLITTQLAVAGLACTSAAPPKQAPPPAPVAIGAPVTLGPAARIEAPVELVQGADRLTLVFGERHVQASEQGFVEVAPAAPPARFPDKVVQAVRLERGVEAARIEQQGPTVLAFARPGEQVELVSPPRALGPTVPGLSPAAHSSCAAPSVQRIAARGDTVVALVSECHVEAPLRLVWYQFPGPGVYQRRLESPGMGSSAEELALTRDGVALVATRDRSRSVVWRVPRDGEVARVSGPGGVAITAAVQAADDGSAWTYTIGDLPVIARDGIEMSLADPSGAPLRPFLTWGLAYDRQLGIVVIAGNDAGDWVLAERPPTGALATLPPPPR